MSSVIHISIDKEWLSEVFFFHFIKENFYIQDLRANLSKYNTASYAEFILRRCQCHHSQFAQFFQPFVFIGFSHYDLDRRL